MAVCSRDPLAGFTAHFLHASGLVSMVSAVDLRVSLVVLTTNLVRGYQHILKNKMADILQKIFSNAFSLIQIIIF